MNAGLSWPLPDDLDDDALEAKLFAPPGPRPGPGRCRTGPRTKRYRLNGGGNRHANVGLWRIVITRMSSDPRTQAYVARPTEEGLTKGEIIRVLKRYVAREVYRYLRPGLGN